MTLTFTITKVDVESWHKAFFNVVEVGGTGLRFPGLKVERRLRRLTKEFIMRELTRKLTEIVYDMMIDRVRKADLSEFAATLKSETFTVEIR